MLGVGAYAVAAEWAGGVVEGVLALPALYAVAVSAAVLLSYLLYARARVCDDERLRWLGAGYALAGAAALLQALTLPGFAVADPFGTSANGAAALYMVGHATIPTFALVAALFDALRCHERSLAERVGRNSSSPSGRDARRTATAGGS